MAHGPVPGAGKSAVAEEQEDYHTGRAVRLAMVAAIGGFLFGFDSAVINGAKNALQNTFDLTGSGGDAMIGFIVAVALLGSAVGAWFAGSLATRFGRRPVMVIAAVMFFIAAIGQAFPFDVWDMILWRVIGGAGIGVASVVAPMYIAEIAPASLRGRMGSLQQLAIVIGIFTTGVTNYIILELATANGTVTPGAVNADGEIIYARNEWLLGLEAWQWMFLIMVVPALIYGLLAFTIPESPRYLVAQGKEKEAERVLDMVFVGDQHDKIVDIRASVGETKKPKLADLRGATLGLRPLVWVGIMLAVFQQAVGINAIFYYSNTIWGAVGFGESQAFLITMITNTTNVVITFVAIALVDKVGRKPLLLVGSLGMAVTLLGMTVVFATATTVDGQPKLEGFMGPLAVICANLYVVFFAATWGPVMWVLLGEMFPNSIRAAAMAVAVAANWVANFIVTYMFPVVSGVSISLAYAIFTVCAVISFFLVAKFVKETKGITLEDMSDHVKKAQAS